VTFFNIKAQFTLSVPEIELIFIYHTCDNSIKKVPTSLALRFAMIFIPI